MQLTESQLRTIIRRIIIEALEEEEEESEVVDEEPMGDESKMAKAYKIAKTAYSYMQEILNENNNTKIKKDDP